MVKAIKGRKVRAMDVAQLAANLRECDRQEALATAGPDILAALMATVAASSFVVTFAKGDEVLAMFGVVPGDLMDPAAPWMMCAKGADRYPGVLTFQSKRYLARVLSRHKNLANYVDARNAKSIRWLKWLGFTLAPAAPYGVVGYPFHRFELAA